MRGEPKHYIHRRNQFEVGLFRARQNRKIDRQGPKTHQFGQLRQLDNKPFLSLAGTNIQPFEKEFPNQGKQINRLMIGEQESATSGRNRFWSENVIDDFKGIEDPDEVKLFRSEKHQDSKSVYPFNEIECQEDSEATSSLNIHCRDYFEKRQKFKRPPRWYQQNRGPNEEDTDSTNSQDYDQLQELQNVQVSYNIQPSFQVDQVSTSKKVQAHRSPSSAQESRGGFQVKRKTELCKNFESKGECRFGDECAFAHSLADLKKKTHVAARYKLTLCESYHKAPFFCQYGLRCQFVHLQRNFTSFEDNYRQLLDENALQMTVRLENTENPDLSVFNVAFPKKERLSVFREFVNQDSDCESEQKITVSKNKGRKAHRKQRKNKDADYCDYNYYDPYILLNRDYPAVFIGGKPNNY